MDPPWGAPTKNLGAGAGEPTRYATPAGTGPPEDELLPPWVLRVERDGRMVPILGGIPLLRLLGRGGMGAVFFGRHPRLDRPVAVKVLPWKMGEMKEAADRFRREGQLAAEIRSPFLVRLYEAGDDRGIPYLVFEYVDGMTASDYLRRLQENGVEHLAEHDALDIAIAAARGLVALHDKGIVHRDVKPGNLFLVRDRSDSERFDLTRTKLGDLGLVHAGAEDVTLTQTNVALGTPGFMAPEQGMDAKRVGPAADVFGLGATLYTFLRGEPPFQGPTHMATIMATMKQPALPIRTVRPDVSIETGMLIHKALQKDPRGRHGRADDLLQDLLNCRNAVARQPDAAAAPFRLEKTKVDRSLAAWAEGRGPWRRVPLAAGMIHLAVMQLRDATYSGPLHQGARLLHDQLHAHLGETLSRTTMAFAGAAGPLAVALALFLAMLLLRVWFSLFVALGIVGAVLHQSAQELLRSTLPGAANAACNDWPAVLAALGSPDAAPLANVLGEAANLVLLGACAGIVWVLAAVFRAARRL